MKKLFLVPLLLLTVAFTACGGGGGSSSGSSGNSGSTTPNVLTITSNATLPETVSGLPYSVTLAASNGTQPLKWTISSISQLTFPDGLTVDSASGVISGSPKFGGAFLATVTDANSKTASKQFTLSCYGTLTGGTSNWTTYEYYYFFQGLSFQGGKGPFTYSVSSGALPKGLRVDSLGRIIGNTLEFGTFSAVITARDSWSTPQTADAQVNITVSGQPLYLGDNFQAKQLVNRPIVGKLFSVGGVPPYTYRLVSGLLPPGITIDANTGDLLGTSASPYSPSFQVEGKDSTGATTIHFVNFQVVAGSGRNDSVNTATPIDNGGVVATLSPYIDPPDKAPTAADTDYYRLSSIAGTIINLSATVGGGPIDPVIEVLDGNAQRLSTCNVPDNTSQTFTSTCINDEDGKGGHNASLAYKVPGTAPAIVNSYIHVLDWRGDARPDMQYFLNVAGNIKPIYDQFSLARGVSVNRSFYAQGAWGMTTWALDSGALPDGLNLSDTGALTGIPTTDGDYSFRVKAVDSSTPPQTFYVFATAKVVEPLKITSPAVWPNACVGQSYSYTITTINGVAPLTYYRADSTSFPLFASYGPTFFANPTTVGTYALKVGVYDSAGGRDIQDITLTVVNCP
jgi:large repetitive protein